MWELFVAKEQGITLDYLQNCSIEKYYMICYSVIKEIEARNKKE